MKRFYLQVLFLCVSFAVYADKLTVDVATEGTLQQVILEQDVTKITDLTITGRINAADIIYLRSGVGRMASIETLDLNSVELIASEEPYLSYKTGGSFSGSGSVKFYISDDEHCDSVQVPGSQWVSGGATYYHISIYGKNLEGAFMNMTTLKKVVLPSNVKKIGSDTFSECTNLESVEAPAGIKEIGGYAFKGCSSLLSTGITSSVIKVGDYAYSGCSSLIDSGDLSHVNHLGKEAFSGCTSMKGNNEGNLDLSCLKEIPYYAFYKCENLKNISFSKQLLSIGRRAFANCTGIESLLFYDGLTSIDEEAFYGCTNLAEISIPSTFSSVDINSFAGTAWLASQKQNQGMVYLGNVALGYFLEHNSQYEYPTSLTFREGTSGIADNFGYMWDYYSSPKKASESITEVSFPTSLRYIGDNAFSKYSITHIELPEGLEAIGEKAFADCEKLEDFSMPTTLKVLGNGAFQNCKSLSKITIPEHVTELDGAFDGCSGIVQLNINATNFKKGWQYGSVGDLPGLEKLVIGGKVQAVPEIGGVPDYMKIVFEDRPSDSYLYFGYSYKSVKDLVLPDCKIELGEGAFRDRALPLEIKGVVIKIGDDALSGCSGLSSIRLGEMTELPVGALQDCKNLHSVDLPSILTFIGAYAFDGCTSLQSLIIPKGVTEIGERAFAGCERLTGITLPAGLAKIGWSAFGDCISLTSVSIPNGVNEIEETMFSGCKNLTIVNLPEGLKQIAQYAFEKCEKLSAIRIPSTVESIGNNAFYQCVSLESIVIPSAVKSLRYPFRECGSLRNVTVESVEPVNLNSYIIDEKALVTLYVPFGSKLKYQSARYWRDFTEIIEYYMDKDGIGYLPQGETISICQTASCTEEADIPGTASFDGKQYLVTEIQERAFENSTQLAKVCIPTSVQTIGARAFAGCTGLKEIYCYNPAPVDLTASAAEVRTRAGAKVSQFEGVDVETCILYVPVGSADDYASADGWSEFKVIKEFVVGDDDPTGFAGVPRQSVGQPGAYYNLSGQRVERAVKGIYIKDGRKVIIR